MRDDFPGRTSNRCLSVVEKVMWANRVTWGKTNKTLEHRTLTSQLTRVYSHSTQIQDFPFLLLLCFRLVFSASQWLPVCCSSSSCLCPLSWQLQNLPGAKFASLTEDWICVRIQTYYYNAKGKQEIKRWSVIQIPFVNPDYTHKNIFASSVLLKMFS